MTNFEALLAAAPDNDAYWQSRVKLQAATQLQDLLAASGLNQEQWAQKLGVKPPQVSRILSGLGNPTLDTLVKMAGALGYVPQLTFVPTQSSALDAAAACLSSAKRKPLKDAQISTAIKARLKAQDLGRAVGA